VILGPRRIGPAIKIVDHGSSGDPRSVVHRPSFGGSPDRLIPGRRQLPARGGDVAAAREPDGIREVVAFRAACW